MNVKLKKKKNKSIMRARESSYFFSPKPRRDPSLVFTAFLKNPKSVEIKILSVQMGWLLSVVPCVHLFYPANEFASVVLLCKYNLLANLSARNFTETTSFRQKLVHTNERQCLQLQNIFLKPKSGYHNHLSKVNFMCTRDFTDLRTIAVLE